MTDARNFGERIADKITEGMGTWRFIIAQALFTSAWLIINTVFHAWDKYPYVLLNLVYSFQAGFTGPILLLSQNRQVARDSTRIEQDLEADVSALAITKKIAEKLGVEV